MALQDSTGLQRAVGKAKRAHEKEVRRLVRIRRWRTYVVPLIALATAVLTFVATHH